jgi:hypothetical protein
MDKPNTFEWRGVKYLVWHGDPFDRGSADSYYGRPCSPHKYPNGTGNAPRVEHLTEVERAEYLAGYAYNEERGDKKSWD